MVGKIKARNKEERAKDRRKGCATPWNLIDGGVGRGTEPESVSTPDCSGIRKQKPLLVPTLAPLATLQLTAINHKNRREIDKIIFGLGSGIGRNDVHHLTCLKPESKSQRLIEFAVVSNRSCVFLSPASNKHPQSIRVHAPSFTNRAEHDPLRLDGPAEPPIRISRTSQVTGHLRVLAIQFHENGGWAVLLWSLLMQHRILPCSHREASASLPMIFRRVCLRPTGLRTRAVSHHLCHPLTGVR